MPEELFKDLALERCKRSQNRISAPFLREILVTLKRLLDLNRVVGRKLRRCVDRRQATADDNGRKPYLKIGQGASLKSSCELQCHQKIRRFANTARQIVLHVDDGGPAGAGRNSNVVEAPLPGIVDRQSSPESNSAVNANGLPTRQGKVEQGQKILVPADRDTVLRNTAEPLKNARVEVLVDVVP